MSRLIQWAVLLGLATFGRAAEKPNFLFIYTDDQRYDAMSVVQKEQGAQGRFPWFQTPNMDRLAAEGVRFRNAFVVNSLCAPSRAVNLTGRYNHFNGIASNFRPFPVDNVTHATLLRTNGYTTAYIGKWHMDSQRERPGFDYHASFIAHARYPNPLFIVDGKDTPTQGWIDDISTDYAIEFMRRQKGSGKPWSLVVGFKSPHGPCEPPARAQNRFAGEQARAVPNLPAPTPYLSQTNWRATATNGLVPVNLNYFRCISAADDCLGRLLTALDEFGYAQNTVVIYTSDNGFYLGEHGLGDKRSAYDESLRVPFLVRYPALGDAARGRVVDYMVLNLDLAPTLLDYAGVPIPATMQGRSWRPLLDGRQVEWRQSWFYEYFAENQAGSRVPDITAVRTTQVKLIKYPGHDEWSELFDLKADPYEIHNLYREPASAALRAQLEAEHDRLAKEVGYVVPAYVDRPSWWGRTSNADTNVELRLLFEFAHLDGERAGDTSGQNNHGKIHNVTLVEGRQGRKAAQFKGDSWIEVANTASLNPADIAWTVEAVVRPDKPDGMILARGGASQGYALWLKEGRAQFTVVAGRKPVTAAAKKVLQGWSTLRGTITGDGQAVLHVNGQLAGSAKLPSLIGRNPLDAMQIGADLNSLVIEPAPPKFTGLIERIRIIKGEPPP